MDVIAWRPDPNFPGETIAELGGFVLRIEPDSDGGCRWYVEVPGRCAYASGANRSERGGQIMAQTEALLLIRAGEPKR